MLCHPQQRRYLPLVAGLLIGTVWATTRLWDYLRADHAYYKALSSVDPIRVTQWNQAVSYETLARSLNRQHRSRERRREGW